MIRALLFAAILGAALGQEMSIEPPSINPNLQQPEQAQPTILPGHPVQQPGSGSGAQPEHPIASHPTMMPRPVEQSSSSSSSSSTQTFHHPDFQAILASCETDFADCKNHRRRHHHRHHHGGHHQCIKYARKNWDKLSATCRATIIEQLPCAEDSVTQCPNAEGRHEVFECLSALEKTKVTSRCSQWMKDRESWMSGEEGHHEGRPSFFEDYHGEEMSLKAHKPLIFAAAAIALFGAIVGSCLTMCCCLRRNRRALIRAQRCSCRGNGGVIPLHHIPSRGATNYAVMSDDVARAHPI